MTQLHKTKNLERLITLLSDGQWHSADELSEKVNCRFGTTVHEARSRGYSVEVRRVSDNQYEYRISNEALSLEKIKALSPQLTERIPYLRMLVLFGSRATGKTHINSDWDFATLYDEKFRKALITNPFDWFEVPTIISQLLEVPDNKVDVVELNDSSYIIAHFVAHDGILLYEKEPGEFEEFRRKALKSDLEMKEIRNSLREKIESDLRRWGV